MMSPKIFGLSPFGGWITCHCDVSPPHGPELWPPNFQSTLGSKCHMFMKIFLFCLHIITNKKQRKFTDKKRHLLRHYWRKNHWSWTVKFFCLTLSVQKSKRSLIELKFFTTNLLQISKKSFADVNFCFLVLLTC